MLDLTRRSYVLRQPRTGMPRGSRRQLCETGRQLDRAIGRSMVDSAAQSRRRFLRISLRGLLLVVLAIAASLAWARHVAEQQRRVVAELERMGCNAIYASSGDDADCFISSLSPIERLRFLYGDDKPQNVTGVEADSPRFGDDGLERLRSLPYLRSLELNGTSVSEAGLARVGSLTALERLTLRRTSLTDAGLVHLQKLDKLCYLDLCDTSVTDAGLVHLRGMLQLRFLFLQEPVTLAGVPRVTRVPAGLFRLSHRCGIARRRQPIGYAKA